jgi:RecB family exonuclease
MRAALDEIEARVVRAVEWSLADDAWDFSLAEASFGKRADAWEAVVLDDEVATLRLAGTIDRVDVSHEQTELRVVDYKRSEDGARRLTAGLGEDSFQLAVYARAAVLALGKPVTSGMYLPTRYLPPVYRTRGSDTAWARAHAEDGGRSRFEKRALELIATVRRGLIDPRPKSPDTCRWCDHDGACRKPRFVITSTAGEESDDPRAGA